MDESDAIIGASGFDVRQNEDGSTTVIQTTAGLPGAPE